MTTNKGALALAYLDREHARMVGGGVLRSGASKAAADLRALMAERDLLRAILADNLPRLERIIGADRRDARLAMEALRDHASGINAVRAALAECGGAK